MKLIFAVLVFLVIVISGCIKEDGIACECVETCSCVVPDSVLLNSIKNYCDIEYQELAEPKIIEEGCCQSGYPNKLTKMGTITPKNESVRTRCSRMTFYIDELGNDVLCRCSWI